MTLYHRQKEYFKQAYQTGEHGWPVEEATPFVLRALKRIRKSNGRNHPVRMLDLGCGEGRHTMLCAREGFYAVGLDDQPLAIHRAGAIAREKRTQGDLRFAVGDVFHLPFKGKSFGGLIDFGCLHHVKISDTRRYLDSVLPLLRSRGFFILSCFSTRFRHHPGEKRRRNWLIHRGHYDRFFRKQDFKTLFGKTFEILVIEEESQGLSNFWNVLMRKKQ